MWICNIFLLVRTVSSERIMGRHMVFSVTIKIIVSAGIAFSHAKQRPIAIALIWWKPWWDQLVTGASLVFDDRTVDVTFPPKTKLPGPGWHTSQLLMLLLIRTCLPSCFQCEKFMASLSVSFNGGVMKIGALTSFLASEWWHLNHHLNECS